MTLGATTTGTGNTGSETALGIGTGVGLGTRMGVGVGVGGFSRSSVIGARYCTTERKVGTTGTD